MRLISTDQMSTPFALRADDRNAVLVGQQAATGKIADGTVPAVLSSGPGQWYAGSLRIIPDEFFPVAEALAGPFDVYYLARDEANARIAGRSS